jgi:hypothetical protein
MTGEIASGDEAKLLDVDVASSLMRAWVFHFEGPSHV